MFCIPVSDNSGQPQQHSICKRSQRRQEANPQQLQFWEETHKYIIVFACFCPYLQVDGQWASLSRNSLWFLTFQQGHCRSKLTIQVWRHPMLPRRDIMWFCHLTASTPMSCGGCPLGKQRPKCAWAKRPGTARDGPGRPGTARASQVQRHVDSFPPKGPEWTRLHLVRHLRSFEDTYMRVSINGGYP